MRPTRTLVPVVLLAAASLAFVGVSAALEDDSPSVVEEPTTTVPAPECPSDTTDDTSELADQIAASFRVT